MANNQSGITERHFVKPRDGFNKKCFNDVVQSYRKALYNKEFITQNRMGNDSNELLQNIIDKGKKVIWCNTFLVDYLD